MIQVFASKKRLLLAKDIVRSFGTNVVLSGVDLEIREGECIGLVGDNASGKSTLLHILSGKLPADSGDLISGLDREVGVGLVAQKFRLDPGLTVAGAIHRETGAPTWQAEQKTRVLLAKAGIALNERARVGGLTRSELGLIESVRLWADETADVALLDEASATLNSREIGQLHWIVDQIRSQGRGVVYVSHRLGEIQKVADKMFMLRDGVLHDMGDDPEAYEEMLSGGVKRNIHAAKAAPTPPPVIVAAAAPGSEPQEQASTAPPEEADTDAEEMDPRLQESDPRLVDGDQNTSETADSASGQNEGATQLVDPELQPREAENAKAKVFFKEALNVNGFSSHGVSDATFTIAPGQIVGLLGERKSGIHEFINGIAGKTPPRHGVVEVLGRRISVASTDDAALGGIGFYEPEISPELMGKSLVAGQVPDGDLEHASGPYVAALQAMDSIDDTCVELFGRQSPGQRASRLLSLLLLSEVPVIVLEEPTAHLDQKARDQLFQELSAARERGSAILVLTSEVEELVSWTDRVLVFESGRLTNNWDSTTVTSVRVNEVLNGGGVPSPASKSMNGTRATDSARPKVTTAGLDWLNSVRGTEN